MGRKVCFWLQFCDKTRREKNPKIVLRELIVQYAPLAILAVLFVFALAKIYIISSSGVKHNLFRIFFGSLEVLSDHVIKNTFEEELQHYYKSSNRVNALFYCTIGLIIAVYVLMIII
jgi:hypothetical protein